MHDNLQILHDVESFIDRDLTEGEGDRLIDYLEGDGIPDPVHITELFGFD